MTIPIHIIMMDIEPGTVFVVRRNNTLILPEHGYIMNERIILKVVIIGVVIIGCMFSYTLYKYPTKIVIQPVKTDQSVKLNNICDNTSRFVEMCYDYGYNNKGSFIDLHNIIDKASESNESLSLVSRICEKSFIAGKTDLDNNTKRDAYKVSNDMCHEYMKVL